MTDMVYKLNGKKVTPLKRPPPPVAMVGALAATPPAPETGLAGPCPPEVRFPWGASAVRLGDFVFQEVDMDSEMAKEILKHNHPDQRQKSEPYVERLTCDMDSGHWKLTAETITFGEDWYLINGQQRCEAAARSKRSIRVLVAWNPTLKYADPIDQGRKRSFAEIIKTDVRRMAAIQILRSLEAGKQLDYATLPQAVIAYARYHDVFERLALTIPHFKRLSGPELAACVFALPCDEAGVIEFANQIATGAMLKEGEAAFACRNWRAVRRKEMTRWQVTMAVLNCLRYHLNHVTMNSVFTGEMGYRAFCGKRRLLHVPGTPPPGVVAGAYWVPERGRHGSAVQRREEESLQQEQEAPTDLEPAQ